MLRLEMIFQSLICGNHQAIDIYKNTCVSVNVVSV